MTGERRAYRRKLPHVQEVGRTFFVTFRTKTRRRLPDWAKSLVLDRCVYAHGRSAILHVAVVMPDHVHLILTPIGDEAGRPHRLETIMQGIKGISARRINLKMERTGVFWDAESFDHMLRSDESLEAKVAYVCENAVRKGLVDLPEDYPWLWRLSVDGESESPD